MADDLKTDAEKAEELKAWWQNNGTSIVVGIALAIGSMFGYDYFKQHQHDGQIQAANAYAEIKAIDAFDQKGLKEKVQSIQTQHARSTSATLATLHYAKLLAESDQLDSAATQLQWAQKHHRDESYAPLINLRLARVYKAQGEHEKSLALLDQSYPAAFLGLKEEVRGDIFQAQKQWKEAKLAYQQALDAPNTQRAFVQIKLDNLPRE